jgi:GT2 family glycosyltransferase
MPSDDPTDPASPPAELEALRTRLEAQERELDGLRRALAGELARAQTRGRRQADAQRELEQLRTSATVAAQTVRLQVERVGQSAAWRYGHAASRAVARARGRRPRTAGGVAAALGQIDRLLELLGAPALAPASGERSMLASGSGAERAATREEEVRIGAGVRGLLGPPLHRDGAPPVSVVIVSRSARRAHDLIMHLERTSYPSLEVVLVDNACPGGEVGGLAQAGSARALTVVALDPAVGFAAACNRGAARAGGRLLVFLNDDVRPLDPDWLHELVDTHRHSGEGIVGATLVDPRLEADQLEKRLRDGPSPLRREAGQALTGGRFGTDVPAVAVSAACLALSADLFHRFGGFDTGYQYGLEDVELCLRARAEGHTVVCSGRCLMLHDGSVTQAEAGREFRRVNREINHRRLRERWGPWVVRERLRGLLDADPRWGEGPRLCIVETSTRADSPWGDRPTAAQLAQAAARLGWRVDRLGERDEPSSPISEDLDLAVVLVDGFDVRALPPHTIVCAWVRNWTQRWLSRPWLERCDVLLAGSEAAADRLREATGRPVHVMALAADPDRFRPAPAGQTPERDWVLTVNRWGEPRAVEAALQAGLPGRGAIHGRGWEHAGLGALPVGWRAHPDLPHVYRGARVALDDTAEVTRVDGLVNARVFEALACGVPVLTNGADGVRALFDDAFPVWSTARECADELARLLEDPAAARARAAGYRHTVLTRHTWEHRARALRRIVAAENERLSFALKVGAPDAQVAERWGDLHLARSLGRALRRAGHRWRIDLLPDWNGPASAHCDVVVHLWGRSRYDPAPGQFNVLWVISHPDELDPAALAGYDLVCVASARYARQLASAVQIPVHPLAQATDPRVFFPDPEAGLAHELAFVGNTRGVSRKLLDDLLPTDHDLAIWGGGWEGTAAARHVQADHVANDSLRRIYSSAQIVLCDHWPDMRAHGFAANRIYDALACGALVVSDDVAGLGGSFGDAVVTYEEPAQLRELIERLLANPAERAARVTGARARILASETFDDRARTLLALVRDVSAPPTPTLSS